MPQKVKFVDLVFYVQMLALAFSMPAQAQQFVKFETSNDTNDGIQILADDTMTFNDAAGTFQATGNAQVLFEDIVVFGDVVEAVFEDQANAGRTVSEFVSEGDVYFASADIEGQADRLDADLGSESYFFSGVDVQIITAQGRLLSDQLILIDQSQGSVEATSSLGNSYLVREQDTIAATQLGLHFEVLEDNGGLGDLQQLVATGGVRADFGGAQLSADSLVTDAAAIEVQLFGNVIVQQGSAILGGNCMVYNTETGDASLFQCPDNQGAGTTERVRGRLVLSE